MSDFFIVENMPFQQGFLELSLSKVVVVLLSFSLSLFRVKITMTRSNTDSMNPYFSGMRCFWRLDYVSGDVIN